MSLSGPTEFEAVAAEDGLAGAGLQGTASRRPTRPAGDRRALALGHRLAPAPPRQGRARRRRRDRAVHPARGVRGSDRRAVRPGLRATQHNTGPADVLDTLTGLPNGAFSGASGTYWLGVTPLSGQDILTNLLYGARTSLVIVGARDGAVAGARRRAGVVAGLLPRLGRHDHLPRSWTCCCRSRRCCSRSRSIAVVQHHQRRAGRALLGHHLRARVLRLPVHRPHRARPGAVAPREGVRGGGPKPRRRQRPDHVPRDRAEPRRPDPRVHDARDPEQHPRRGRAVVPRRRRRSRRRRPGARCSPTRAGTSRSTRSTCSSRASRSSSRSSRSTCSATACATRSTRSPAR